MIRSRSLLFASALLLLACAHQPPVTLQKKPEPPARLYDGGKPPAAGTRFAIRFNNEPMIVIVADGLGGPPFLYHGEALNPDRLKSIIMLKTKEARERFGDQTLDAAILIELK